MDNQIPKPLIIIISLIQGLFLTLLYQSIEYGVWPSEDPVWLTALLTFSITFPFLTLLCITKSNYLSTIKYILPFSLLLSLAGAYVGFQQTPIEFINDDSVVSIFVLTGLIASFKVLMYVQQYASKQKISYSSLFTLSWRNFIIFAECWLFVLIFWGILHLGAGLFSILNIDFFEILLRKAWFFIPVLNLAFGFAIIVFRNITHTADTISTILQTLIKFLLPALTIISLGFLATLLFTGLDTLWQTGKGSSLSMWLQALTLFFVNAVYQGASSERPYHKVLHRLIFVGVAALPIYSIISFYGIYLRIDQYGLTVARCWALLICILLTCFSFGYFISIIKKRDAWLEIMSKVNVAMGVVIAALMLLVNTPILNFQSFSANSLLNTLRNGEASYEEFNFDYFGYNLGRQGYLALKDFKPTLEENAPDKIAYIDDMYINHKYATPKVISIEDFTELVVFWPNKDLFPQDLIQAIYDENTQWSRPLGDNLYFVAKDLNDDGVLNFILISEDSYSVSAKLWQKKEEYWQSYYMISDNDLSSDTILGELTNNKIKTIKPKWNDLKVGDITFTFGNSFN